MKTIKILLIGLMTLAVCFPSVALAETTELSDGLSIDLDDSWIVVTRDNCTDDVLGQAYVPLDESELMDYFDKDKTLVASLMGTEETNAVWLFYRVDEMPEDGMLTSLSALDDSDRQFVMGEFLSGDSDSVYEKELWDTGETVFIKYRDFDSDDGYNYVAIENKKLYIITSVGVSDDNKAEQVESIMKTVKIEKNPAYAEDVYISDEELESVMNSSEEAAGIAGRVLCGCIILAIITILFARRNRKKVKEQTAANLMRFTTKKSPGINTMGDGEDDSLFDGKNFKVIRTARAPLKVTGTIKKNRRSK